MKTKFERIFLKGKPNKHETVNVILSDWSNLEKKSTALINNVLHRKPIVNFRQIDVKLDPNTVFVTVPMPSLPKYSSMIVDGSGKVRVIIPPPTSATRKMEEDTLAEAT